MRVVTAGRLECLSARKIRNDVGNSIKFLFVACTEGAVPSSALENWSSPLSLPYLSRGVWLTKEDRRL